MSSQLFKIPGPDHPIAIAPNPARVIVKIGGRVVADSRNALTLKEASLSRRTIHTARGC